MELKISEVADDVSVRYRCDLCNFNPYQEWCKGNVARFHAALMKHKQSRRHIEAEAFARGEQPVSISKGGKISADAPASERPPHFYITKMETMIDKLEQQLKELRLPSTKGSVAVAVDSPQKEEEVPKGKLIRAYEFKDVEVEAMQNYGDRSAITNTNAFNAVCRLYSWVEVYEKDEERRMRSLTFLKKTSDEIKSLIGMMAEGWRIEDDDYNVIGERLDDILEYDFSIYEKI